MTARAFLIGILGAAFLAAPSHATASPEAARGLFGDEEVERSFDFAKQQLTQTLAVTPVSSYPILTDNRATVETYGRWITRALPKPNFPDWRIGFFPGSLWLTYEFTRDPYWREQAEQWTAPLDYVQNNTTTHDIGFQMMSAAGNALRLTGNPRYKPILLRSAESLATRFDPTIGSTQSWSWGIPQNWTFPVIVDNMLNLELLFWSAANGGPRSHYDIALSHALRTREDHVRPDGGTYHVVDYDPTTGNVIKKMTWQGYDTETTWARGEAWALYGFTMAYRYTRDPRLLETAKRVADYYIAHVATDGWVGNWDFQAPAKYKQKDSSSAAIAAAGLIELATLADDRWSGKRYFYRYSLAAERTLNALYRHYLAANTPHWGILVHGTGNYPISYKQGEFHEIDVSLIYGDYYFLEALLRYKNLIDCRRER